MKVLMTQPIPRNMVDWCQKEMPEGVVFEAVASLSDEDWARSAADADILWSADRPIDAHLLAMAPRVRFIQHAGMGYNNIDVAAVAAAGITAAYMPGLSATNVAEHAIMLMLVLLRHFTIAEQGTRAGGWPRLDLHRAGVDDLATSTIGLVGLGYVGRAVATRLAPFGSRLLYHARHRAESDLESRLGLTYRSLPDLLAASKIVSLHVPLTPETRHLIGAAQLAAMPRGALLVNVSRGAVVDELALRQAIESGHLAGAALDVLEREEEGGNPFVDMPQVIVTPHVAGLSRSIMETTLRRGAANIARLIAGEPVHDPIPGTEAAREKGAPNPSQPAP